MTRHRGMAIAAVAVLLFVFLWFLRFNDPNGSFAGLSDDHYFYLVRGWQILYGELPVRDFVDHGAPLYYGVAAAVQTIFGRGTLSELAFSATTIALGGALTFWLAVRASGSIAAGLLGAGIQAWLLPRFYNYPKILVYTVAIPLLWWFADRPGRRPLFWLALTTAVGFLFRFDHGAFVAAGVAILLLLLREVPWRQRLGFGMFYALVVILLLAPYFAFVQANGGVVSYLTQASAWAARERDRTPVVWPGLFDNPDGVSDPAREGWLGARVVATVRDNRVAWWYYLEVALPLFALAVLAMTRDAVRPGWGRAAAKIALVALLAVVLDAGFLRSPLAARLADPSVPHAILVAWLAIAVPALARSPQRWSERVRPWRRPLVPVVVSVAALFAFVMAATVTGDYYDRLEAAGLTEGPRVTVRQAVHVAETVRTDWDLESWAARPDRPELMTLALYLHRCTSPNARVFVQPYIPAVLALARRGFAGGHADLRPGFFTSREAQRLTLERLRAQDVPVALLETGDSLRNFRESFPLITAYLDDRYVVAGTRVFDDRFGITLLLRRDLRPRQSFEELGWPCPASASQAAASTP